MYTLSLLHLLLSWSTVVFALDLNGYVQWNDLCPDYMALGNAKVLLDAGKMSGRVTRNGNFSIPDVPAGLYVLSVLSHDHLFDQIRIDVSPEELLPHVQSYTFGTPLTKSSVSLPYPVVLIPRHRNVYFSPRESFNLLGMFQSPMMMIMVLTGGMMLAMPYIMKNLDPQALDGIKGQQTKAASFHDLLQNGDPRGLSALLDADEPSTPAIKSSPSSSTPQQKKSGKGNRRR